MNKTRYFILLFFASLFIFIVQSPEIHIPGFKRLESVWSIAVYEGDTPFDLDPISNDPVVLKASSINDKNALFTADPFVVNHDNKLLMFFEILDFNNYQGDIGLAFSNNFGLDWDYQGVVIDEDFHLSYPFVFSWEGEWYLLPEAMESGAVRLYKADEFPNKWKLAANLLYLNDYADPTLYFENNTWWMFFSSSANKNLNLYFSENLYGPWMKHPKSPIISGDANIARPGGKLIKYEGDVYRITQDCSPIYGNQLRVFRVLELNRVDYNEIEIENSPILKGDSVGWNSNGMHHVSYLKVQGKWRAFVDGHNKKWYLK